MELIRAKLKYHAAKFAWYRGWITIEQRLDWMHDHIKLNLSAGENS